MKTTYSVIPFIQTVQERQSQRQRTHSWLLGDHEGME